MNPITTISASCNLLRNPLTSPLTPRKGSWTAPSICQFSKTGLTVPNADSCQKKKSCDGARRGSHDKRNMFAYSDQKQDQTKKKKKLQFETTAHKQTKHGDEGAQEPKKKRLKEVAKDIRQTQKINKGKNKTKNSKNCVLM